MTPRQKHAWSTLTAAQVGALDRLTQRYTAFPTFRALVTAKRGYRPTIRRDLTGFAGDVLAAAYNEVQARAGDLRTAYRG